MSSNTITFLEELLEAIEAADGLGALQVSSNCAIGALLRRRGLSDEQIAELDDRLCPDEYIEALNLGQEDVATVLEIVGVNDTTPVSSRRERLIEWIDKRIAELEEKP